MNKDSSQHPPPLSEANLNFFLRTAEITRLDERETADCLALWEEWGKCLFRETVHANGLSFLAVWLEERVDRAVDAAWEKSPSRGFLLNALAQSLCMCSLNDRIPEIAGAGCAPVPAPTPELAAALTAVGLPARVKTGLEIPLRYAVVTRFPYRGRCETCALSPSCPAPPGKASYNFLTAVNGRNPQAAP